MSSGPPPKSPCKLADGNHRDNPPTWMAAERNFVSLDAETASISVLLRWLLLRWSVNGVFLTLKPHGVDVRRYVRPTTASERQYLPEHPSKTRFALFLAAFSLS